MATVPHAMSTPLDGTHRWREALQLWLSWNDAQSQALETLCAGSATQRQVEERLDELEQLRVRAIDLSRQLLAER